MLLDLVLSSLLFGAFGCLLFALTRESLSLLVSQRLLALFMDREQVERSIMANRGAMRFASRYLTPPIIGFGTGFMILSPRYFSMTSKLAAGAIAGFGLLLICWVAYSARRNN